MQKTLVCFGSWISTIVVALILISPSLVEAQIKYSIVNAVGFPKLEYFLVAILNVVIVIATPIVVLFIIYGGFKYVTARGNPAQIQEATQTITYAIIGGVLIIGAVAISKIIANLVTAFKAP